jgi:hypothetical protein
MAVNRVLGVNAALVLKYGTVNQATIKGLNQLTLPSLMRSKIKSEEFGVDFAVNDAGGGEHGDISYAGNLLFGDPGQDALKAYFKDNTKFGQVGTNDEARVYVGLTDFLAADTASDENAGFQVINHTPGQANKNGTFPLSGGWCINGLYCYFTAHKTTDMVTDVDFVAAVTPGTTSATITSGASDFVTLGFKAGDTLIVENSTSNDGIYKILTVAAGTITLEVGEVLTAEAATATTQLHGGRL